MSRCAAWVGAQTTAPPVRIDAKKTSELRFMPTSECADLRMFEMVPESQVLNPKRQRLLLPPLLLPLLLGEGGGEGEFENQPRLLIAFTLTLSQEERDQRERRVYAVLCTQITSPLV